MRLFSFRYKDIKGNENTYDIGVKGPNVTQDSTHRFVTDVEKNAWNAKLDATGNASNLTVAFSQATTRANLKTGEKLSVSLGKIMKFFADMAAVSFSGSYTDLSNRPSIPSGAAASYAVANNDTTTAAGYVADARIVRTHGLEIDQLSSDLSSVRQSFQDGCNTIVAGCTTYGATPAGNSPAQIVAAIKAIYTNRYNNGKNDAENYILGNPNLYNLYTQAQYNANYNSGVAAAKTFQRAEFSQTSYTTENTYIRVTTFDLSSIPGIAAKTLWKDVFVHPGNCHLWQEHIGSVGPTFTLSGSVLTAKQSQITIETIVVYYSNA